MDKKYIKVGETYYVRVRAEKIDEDGWLKVRTSEKAISFILSPKELDALSPLPKYDPCRKFRKGDIVRYVPHNGRECPAMPLDEYYRVKTLTVVEDEDANHRVLVETQDGRNKYIMFCYLELVTPVEELEPFSIYKSDDNEYVILFDDTRVSTFPFKGEGYPYYYTQEQAKARAEQERDRLIAEWRKEMGK